MNLIRLKKRFRYLCMRYNFSRCIIVSFMVGVFNLIVLLSKFKSVEIPDPKVEKLGEIIIPWNNQIIEKNSKEKFLYRKSLENRDNTTCLKRKEFRKELLRFIKHDPRQFNNKDKHILIIGSHTSIGFQCIKNYKKKKVLYTAIRGLFDVDFSSKSTRKLFDGVKYSGCIIVYNPILYHHASLDENYNESKKIIDYYNGLFNFLSEREIHFVFAVQHHIPEEVIYQATKYNGTIVDIPIIADSDAVYDLDNPIMRSVRECKLVGYTKVVVNPYENVHTINATEIAKFLRKQLKSRKVGRFSVYGHSNISTKEAIKYINKRCKISFIENNIEELVLYNQKVKIGTNQNIYDFLDNTFNQFSNPVPKKPYLSIVVTGRADDFADGFQKRLQNFINILEMNSQNVPLASFEVIFVEWAKRNKDKHIYEDVEIPLHLKNRFKFIIVPVEYHIDLHKKFRRLNDFYEFIAKNVGIRRAEGRFVLVTNPDNLLSVELFEAVASHQFNSGVLYRANRYDLLEGWELRYTLDDIFDYHSSPWKENNITIKKRCDKPTTYTVVTNIGDFVEYVNFCATGDFIMLSKYLWEAMGGFVECPANPSVDTIFLAQMMRMVTGFIHSNIHIPTIHQYHPKINSYRPSIENHEEIVKELICNGQTNLLDMYPYDKNWGFKNVSFEEKMFRV